MLRAVQRLADRLRTKVLAMRNGWLTREDAESRGMVLLNAWLSPTQLSQFGKYRYFDVVGSESGKRYRIRYGTTTNVYELNERGRIQMGWCFQPIGPLTAGDVMLAQKIALETSETATLAIANKFPASMPPRAGPAPFG